jgi:hypothetical protein
VIDHCGARTQPRRDGREDVIDDLIVGVRCTRSAASTSPDVAATRAARPARAFASVRFTVTCRRGCIFDHCSAQQTAESHSLPTSQ